MIPGSPLLKAAFVLLPALLTVLAAEGVRRGSLACGDGPAAAARRAVRFAVLAALWAGLALGLAAAGVLERFDWTPPPFLLLPVAVAGLGVAVARSSAGDRLARGVPLAALVGFQAFRLPLELLMHRAYTEGLMPVQMSYAGWNLDILTGLGALGLALASTRWAVPRWVVAAWNVAGLALLLNVVTIAVVSTPRLALFGPDRLNVWVAWPPYVLLPAIMVLAAWAGHLVVFRSLAAARPR